MTLDEDLQKITRFSKIRDLNIAYNQKNLIPEEILTIDKNFGNIITNGENPNLFLNQTPEMVQNEVDNKLKDYSKEAEESIKGNEERIMDLYIENMNSFVHDVEKEIEENEDFKELAEGKPEEKEIKDR